MFSGHTAFCVVCAFFLCMRPRVGAVWQAVVGSVAAGGCVANVLVGDHFTADTLVGAYVAVLVCLLYRRRFTRTFSSTRRGHGGEPRGQCLDDADLVKTFEVTVDNDATTPAEPVRDNGEPMDVDEEPSRESETQDLQHLLFRVKRWRLQEGDG